MKKYYYDYEFERIVDEDEVRRQYECLKEFGNKTYEEFAEDNFSLLDDESVREYIDAGMIEDDLTEENISFDEVRARAEFLGSRTDTEWSEENEDKYTAFEELLNSLYDEKQITGKQFNELVLTAFYDYPEELKEED